MHPPQEWVGVGGLKVDGQIETVYVCNRPTCIRFPPPTHPGVGLKFEN